MKRTYAFALATVTAAITLGISAVAGSSSPRLANPKPAASVKGLRFVFGNTVIAVATGPDGVPPLAYSVARCPRGTHALSGGWDSDNLTIDPITISSNEATRNLGGWIVAARDLSTDNSLPAFTFRAGRIPTGPIRPQRSTISQEHCASCESAPAPGSAAPRWSSPTSVAIPSSAPAPS